GGMARLQGDGRLGENAVGGADGDRAVTRRRVHSEKKVSGWPGLTGRGAPSGDHHVLERSGSGGSIGIGSPTASIDTARSSGSFVSSKVTSHRGLGSSDSARSGHSIRTI